MKSIFESGKEIDHEERQRREARSTMGCAILYTLFMGGSCLALMVMAFLVAYHVIGG